MIPVSPNGITAMCQAAFTCNPVNSFKQLCKTGVSFSFYRVNRDSDSVTCPKPVTFPGGSGGAHCHSAENDIYNSNLKYVLKFLRDKAPKKRFCSSLSPPVKWDSNAPWAVKMKVTMYGKPLALGMAHRRCSLLLSLLPSPALSHSAVFLFLLLPPFSTCLLPPWLKAQVRAGQVITQVWYSPRLDCPVHWLQEAPGLKLSWMFVLGENIRRKTKKGP